MPTDIKKVCIIQSCINNTMKTKYIIIFNVTKVYVTILTTQMKSLIVITYNVKTQTLLNQECLDKTNENSSFLEEFRQNPH